MGDEHEGEREEQRTPRDLVSETIVQRTLTDSDLARMTAMWQQSFEEDRSPQATLKAESSKSSITESKLVIQQHALREVGQQEPGVEQRPDYELLEVIGEGGVGVVYAARQASIDRTVAVKMLRPEITHDAQHQQKFLSEAVVTGDLDHPNIVPIYDLGSNQGGALFYSMKRVQGTPWSEVIRKNSVPENLEILMKVSDAIAFAHSRGVIHRDLKPENVMLGEFGEVLVMDWGIALSTDVFLKQGSISKSSSMGGTPAYMAPEMATGPVEAIGPRSDVYLLGGMLYEVLTGHTPHDGPTVSACLKAAAENRIRPTNRSGELMEIALKALATDPAGRFASVVDFQNAIRLYQSHSESVSLSTRAEEELQTAERTGDYQDYARAMFAFEEAHDLWKGNARARRGAQQARLAYARRALRQEDYDLGISLLDAGDPAHQKLLHRLKAGRNRRDTQQRRVRQLWRTAAALVLLMLVGAVVSVVWITANNVELVVQAKELEKRSQALANQVAIAEYRRVRAEQAEARAVDSEGETRVARDLALQSADEARVRRNEALVERNRSNRSAYRAEIVAANARMDAGQEARDILQSLQRIAPQLRHYEWGRLHYLAEGLATIKQLAGLVESVDATADGRLAVAGCATGDAYVLDFGEVEDPAGSGSRVRVWKLPHGTPIHAVAIQEATRHIVLAGGDPAGGTVSIWDLDAVLAGQSVDEARVPGPRAGEIHADRILSVACSQRHPFRLLTSAADGTVRLWHYGGASSTADDQTLLGHRGPVWQASFSSDERWIVTAGDDGTVRVWQTASGAELQRYQNHKGPVYAAVFAPNSNPPRIASAGINGRIRLWTSSVERLLEIAKELQGDEQFGDPRAVFVDSLLENALEKLGADPSEDTVSQDIHRRLSEFPRDERVLERHDSSVWSLAFSPDGQMLVSTGGDNSIRVWDPHWKPDQPLPKDNAGLLGQLRQDAWARVRRHQDPSRHPGDWLRLLRGHGSAVKSAVFGRAANGQTVIVSGAYDQTVRRWDLDTFEPQRQFDTGQQSLTDVAVTDDGRYLVTSAEDGLAYVFDTRRPKQLMRLTEGHSWLASKAFYFEVDGQLRLVTAAGDSSVRVWNARRATEIQGEEGTGYRGLLAMSDDGKYFATGSEGHTVQIWDAHAVKPVCELLSDYLDQRRRQLRQSLRAADEEEMERLVKSQIPEVTAVAFSPDSSRVFIGDSEGTCHLIRLSPRDAAEVDGAAGEAAGDGGEPPAKVGEPVMLAAAHLVPPFSGHEDAINGAAFTPWGDLLTASDDSTVKQWNAATGELIGSPWRQQLQVRAGDGTRGEPAAVKQLGVYWQSDERVHVITASPAELAYDAEGTPRPDGIRLRHRVLERGQSIGEVADRQSVPLDDDRVNSITFSPPGRESFEVLLACSLQAPNGRQDYLRLWELSADAGGTSGRQIQRLWDDGLDRGTFAWAIFDHQQDAILTVGGKGARLWSREEGRRITSYRPHAAVEAIDIAPAGTYLVAEGPRAGTLEWSETPPEDPQAPFFVLTAGEDNSAKIWSCRVTDTEPPELQRQAIARFDWGTANERSRSGHTRPINSAQFFLLGSQLMVLTASDDGTAKVWDQDPASGLWRVRHTLGGPRGHRGRVNAAAIAPDCRLVATAGDDGRAFIWRLPSDGDAADSGGPIAEARGHVGPARCLAFSPDCRWLATGGADNTVRVWKLEGVEGKPLERRQDEQAAGASVELPLAAELVGHANPVQSVAFSADGHRMVTASEDSTIRVWDTFRISDASRLPEPDEPTRLSELLSLNKHSRSVNAIRFTADGRHLVSASGDGFALLWLADPVAPSIRASDQATLYQPGGVAVDEQLMVMEPTDLASHSATFRVVVSLEASGEDGGGRNGDSFGERLTLDTQAGHVVTQADPADGWEQVQWFDPRTGQPLVVAKLRAQDDRLEFELTREADNWSLRDVLRRVRYTADKSDVDRDRNVVFELFMLGGDESGGTQSGPEPLMTERKLISMSAAEGAGEREEAGGGAGAIHHVAPATLPLPRSKAGATSKLPAER